MNRAQAREIAEQITNQELLEMFRTARQNIKNWNDISKINKSCTRGVTWNILAADFDVNHEYNILAKINMIREFCEFLSDHLKPDAKIKEKREIKVTHQEPNFSNYM